jgi:rfaE bifunctional protein kinase chain/domain
MLDRYFWGSVSRISPEAPVPVIDVENETFHLGGAANVALNLKTLGCNPLLCGVVGADNSGGIIKSIAEQSGLIGAGIIQLQTRPTTVKTRIIGNNQQIARLDREVREEIEFGAAAAILGQLEKYPDLAGIIIEDYNKGVVSKELIGGISRFAANRGVPTFVDPKHHNFFEFKGVTCFKPNRKEAQEALGFTLKTEADFLRAGAELLRRLQCENVLITLGERGMMLFEQSGAVDSVPTRARHVADVSGAGDTAIATLAAMYAGGATIRQAAGLANISAGLVCEEPGIVTILPANLLDALQDITTGEQ